MRVLLRHVSGREKEGKGGDVCQSRQGTGKAKAMRKTPTTHTHTHGTHAQGRHVCVFTTHAMHCGVAVQSSQEVQAAGDRDSCFLLSLFYRKQADRQSESIFEGTALCMPERGPNNLKPGAQHQRGN